MIFRYAYLGHKRLQLKRFLHGAHNARQAQHAALLAKIYRNASSAYGRDHGFREIRNVGDFRTRQPIMSFEDVEPYVERVMRGDVTAMFSPETRVRMFAMSSGTTGRPKHLPLTDELFREYRVGWQIWGAGVYGDHIDLMWKKTLQLSSDWKQSRAPDGTPCGQISGLAAETRPLVARPIFLLPSCVNQVHNSEAKHYLTLRLALVKRLLGMMITANPSTLIELAKRADKHKEMLIRDIHDGTFSTDFSIPEPVRQRLASRLRRGHPRRARELEKIVRDEGALLPKRVWPHLSVLAVWTGGSVGVYLPQVRELYGDVAIRDHGLSASEGRITIPLTDGSSAGILDYRNHYFEFIPVDQHGTTNPTIIEGHELVEGCDYYVLLTTSGGLYRYDIQDVVRCVGFEGEAPLVEFLNKGKSSSCPWQPSPWCRRWINFSTNRATCCWSNRKPMADVQANWPAMCRLTWQPITSSTEKRVPPGACYQWRFMKFRLVPGMPCELIGLAPGEILKNTNTRASWASLISSRSWRSISASHGRQSCARSNPTTDVAVLDILTMLQGAGSCLKKKSLSRAQPGTWEAISCHGR